MSPTIPPPNSSTPPCVAAIPTCDDQRSHRLLREHHEHLRQGGLTDEAISASGIHSLTSPEGARDFLGWFREGLVPAIAFPTRNMAGEIVATALRPDTPVARENGHAPKYEWPRNTASRLGFAPDQLVGESVYRDISVPLVLTEGIKKMLSVAQQPMNLAPVAGSGVYMFHDAAWKKEQKQFRLHQDLSGVPLRERVVYIAFDGNDTTHNPSVIHAEAVLARMLMDTGAQVRLLRIPFSGPEKVGLDDYLLKPNRTLVGLLDGALPGDPLARVCCAKSSSNPAASAELVCDKSFLAALHTAEPVITDAVASEFGRAVRRKTLDAAIDGFLVDLGGTPISSKTKRESEPSLDAIVPNLSVLGEQDGSLVLYATDTRQVRHIRNYRELDYPTLVQIAGKCVIDSVIAREGTDDARVPLSVVKDKIALAARKNQIPSERTFGQGVWARKEHGILIVNGNSALTFKFDESRKSRGAILRRDTRRTGPGIDMVPEHESTSGVAARNGHSTGEANRWRACGLGQQVELRFDAPCCSCCSLDCSATHSVRLWLASARLDHGENPFWEVNASRIR